MTIYVDSQYPLMPHYSKLKSLINRICIETDINVSGISQRDARIWSIYNTRRHLNTLKQILLAVSKKKRPSPLKILNASGASSGHQDFSLSACLEYLDISYEYHCIESPSSKYINNEYFLTSASHHKISFFWHDYSSGSTPKLPYNNYDIVLFTEIAEHLCHTSFLDSLAFIHSCQNPGGSLFLTTPNLLSIQNRIKLFFGSTSGIYWGDGTLNRQQNSYGHISLYSADRLTRILQDTGFTNIIARTTNYGLPPYSLSNFYKPFVLNLLKPLSWIVHGSGSSIELSAHNTNDFVRINLET